MGGRQRQLVDVFFLLVTLGCDAPENTRGNARMQVGGVADRPLAGKGGTTRNGLDVLTANGGQYLFTNLTPGEYVVYIPTPPSAYPASSTPTDNDVNNNDDDNSIS